MIVLQHLIECADAKLLVDQHRHAIADREQAVEVMRHHEYGKPEAASQITDQLVEIPSGDRIEPGGGLVEKDDFRIERQSAGKSGALAHSARQLRGKLAPGILGQADHADFGGRDLIHQAERQPVEFLERHLDILCDRQRAEQGAVLKQDSPAFFDVAPRGIVHRQEVAAEHLDPAGRRPVEPDDRPQQDRFPTSRPANDAKNLAAEHVEVEAVMDNFGAEPVDEAAHADDGFARMLRHGQIPNTEKSTEKAASVTITRKIDSTTDNVVSRPTLSALRDTWKPS